MLKMISLSIKCEILVKIFRLHDVREGYMYYSKKVPDTLKLTFEMRFDSKI